MKNDSTQPPEMNDPLKSDSLDALLREADEYIPDNGFTARVVRQLPSRRHPRWRRWAVLTAALFIGVGLAVWQSPALFAAFNGALNARSLLHWQTLLGFVPLLTVIASLTWTLFAVASEED